MNKIIKMLIKETIHNNRISQTSVPTGEKYTIFDKHGHEIISVLNGWAANIYGVSVNNKNILNKGTKNRYYYLSVWFGKEKKYCHKISFSGTKTQYDSLSPGSRVMVCRIHKTISALIIPDNLKDHS